MDKVSAKIYKNVSDLAKQKKLTIMEIEKRAELANGTIGKWRDSIPKISSVEAVARVLKVSVDRLLRE